MDNAAKALLMAAEILIAVLILTLAVYAFVYYRDVAVTYEKAQVEQEVQKFNNQFTKYLGEEVTAQQIVTLIHIGQVEKVNIIVNHIEMTSESEANVIKFVQNNTSINSGADIKIKEFKCVGISYDNEGKVSEISFKDIEDI